MVEAWYLSLAPDPLGEQHSIDVIRRIQPGTSRVRLGSSSARCRRCGRYLYPPESKLWSGRIPEWSRAPSNCGAAADGAVCGRTSPTDAKSLCRAVTLQELGSGRSGHCTTHERERCSHLDGACVFILRSPVEGFASAPQCTTTE